MTTGKAVLIVGGVGVGALVLYQLFKPGGVAAPRPASTTTTTSNGTVAQGLASLFGGIAGVFNGPTKYGTAATGQGATPTFWSSDAERQANFGNPYYVATDTGGYSAGAYTNYAYADSHPGTALPEGVFGPAIPSTSTAGSGDGLLVPDFA